MIKRKKLHDIDIFMITSSLILHFLRKNISLTLNNIPLFKNSKAFQYKNNFAFLKRSSVKLMNAKFIYV